MLKWWKTYSNRIKHNKISRRRLRREVEMSMRRELGNKSKIWIRASRKEKWWSRWTTKLSKKETISRISIKCLKKRTWPWETNCRAVRTSELTWRMLLAGLRKTRKTSGLNMIEIYQMSNSDINSWKKNCKMKKMPLLWLRHKWWTSISSYKGSSKKNGNLWET